jgi:hypothetical protein
MNLARQNPALYATYIDALRSRFDGISVVLPTPNGPPRRSPDEFLTTGGKWLLVICIVGV